MNLICLFIKIYIHTYYASLYALKRPQLHINNSESFILREQRILKGFGCGSVAFPEIIFDGETKAIIRAAEANSAVVAVYVIIIFAGG